MLINNNCKITGGAGAARSQCVREGAVSALHCGRQGRPAGLAGRTGQLRVMRHPRKVARPPDNEKNGLTK